MGLQRHKRRVTGLAVAGALSATLLVGGRMVARADGGQTQGVLANTTIDLDLAESPLKAAIRLVEQKTGISVVVQGGSSLNGTVTLTVKNKPINEVLKLMANAAGADFWEADGVYFFGPKGSAPKVAPDPIFTQNNILPTEPATHPSNTFAVEKIRLLYADPHFIAHVLGCDNTPMGTMMEIFEAQVIKSMLAAQNPNQAGATTYDSSQGHVSSLGDKTKANIAPTAPSNGYDLNPTLNGAGAAGGAGGGGGQFGGGGAPGAPGGGGFGGGQGGFGQGQGGQGQGQGGQGQGGNQIGAAVSLLPDGIQGLLAFDNDGSVLVRYDPARPEALTELRKIIRLLDVKPRQIQLKTEFVTISQNDIDSFGINFQFQKVNLIGGTQTGYQGNTGQAFLQYATGNLSTQLSFALTTGHAKVVASPSITTLNNMPVAFFVQSQIPIFQSSTILGNGGQTIVTSTINPMFVQTGLSVVARINGDESLTVFGSATNYVLGAAFTDANGNSYPNVTTQTTPIQRIIRNGDTMVIGGLNQKDDTVNTLKVPLLGDLPFIGNLFRSRNVTTDDKELLVFVTPSILPDRVSTAAIGGGGAAIPTGGGGGLPLPGPTP